MPTHVHRCKHTHVNMHMTKKDTRDQAPPCSLLCFRVDKRLPCGPQRQSTLAKPTSPSNFVASSVLPPAPARDPSQTHQSPPLPAHSTQTVCHPLTLGHLVAGATLGTAIVGDVAQWQSA